jgi:hypothetical protein
MLGWAEITFLAYSLTCSETIDRIACISGSIENTRVGASNVREFLVRRRRQFIEEIFVRCR